ncbi:unnamed protein product [Paramecium pentaurelia]|uniref:Uncharacterized protein n=1 Tax=Paramecium pentaurelia TaxID=43138 RepID=A0A8S1SKK4_9CILI|nr:unnamed protein product [Paramecium pentaurelia]
MSVSQEQRISSTSSLKEDCIPLKRQSSIQNLLRRKDFKQVVRILQNQNKSRTNYKKLKYEDQIYRVGQNLCIKGDNRSEYVAKLIKIVKLYDDEDNCIPLIKVQWFYRKNELYGLPKEQMDCISENEVFKTNEFDYIEIESIVGLAIILSYEEYDQIEELNDNIYFTRASFIDRKLHPSIEQWKQVCICHKPANPDLKYVFCDVCQKWCHLKCVGLTQDQADKLNKYVCPDCKN